MSQIRTLDNDAAPESRCVKLRKFPYDYRRKLVLQHRQTPWFMRIADRLNDKCMDWVDARMKANNKRLIAIAREQELLIEFSTLANCRVSTFRKIEALYDKENGGAA